MVLSHRDSFTGGFQCPDFLFSVIAANLYKEDAPVKRNGSKQYGRPAGSVEENGGGEV